jgi:acylpyruvate hydrolase
MGRPEPTHPTLFAKFASTLTGARDPIAIHPGHGLVDWEAELALVVGRAVERADVATARQAIAGYTVANDISMRQWQWRTTQWLQGKAFDRTTPLGPELVSPDELDHARDLRITCHVDGVTRQDARTSDLVFDGPTVVSYVSQFTALSPGDVVLTGTPGGTGAATEDWLAVDSVVTTSIEGIGSCVNTLVAA